jgi:hypothetical protein
MRKKIMILIKRKNKTPQALYVAGMAFLLAGLFANMIADGRLVGEFFLRWITDSGVRESLQGFANGLAIPMLCASIYLNIRYLILLRNQGSS